MSMQIEDNIVQYLLTSVNADICSISIIGSYILDRKLRSGSDIDLVIAVKNINEVHLNFDNIFYKMTKVVDSQGERIELNTKLDGVVLDVTLIDTFNQPNNPLTDWYENHIGWCDNSLCIYGTPLPELFDLPSRKVQYEALREKRLSLVEEKIRMTEDKIRHQGRCNLHILYELQNYIFIREIIKRKIFNRQSLKHPEDSLPDFNDIFSSELQDKCGISLTIAHL